VAAASDAPRPRHPLAPVGGAHALAADGSTGPARGVRYGSSDRPDDLRPVGPRDAFGPQENLRPAPRPMLRADFTSKPASYPVVLANRFGGCDLPEGLRHPASGNTQGGAGAPPPFAGSGGQPDRPCGRSRRSMRASAAVAFGSLSMDDEGMEPEPHRCCRRTACSKALFLSGPAGEIAPLGTPATAMAGRRQSHSFAAANRICATPSCARLGPHSPADSDRHRSRTGLYCKSMGWRQRRAHRAQFKFCRRGRGYLIENGRTGKAVKGATLIGEDQEYATHSRCCANRSWNWRRWLLWLGERQHLRDGRPAPTSRSTAFTVGGR